MKLKGTLLSDQKYVVDDLKIAYDRIFQSSDWSTGARFDAGMLYLYRNLPKQRYSCGVFAKVAVARCLLQSSGQQLYLITEDLRRFRVRDLRDLRRSFENFAVDFFLNQTYPEIHKLSQTFSRFQQNSQTFQVVKMGTFFSQTFTNFQGPHEP